MVLPRFSGQKSTVIAQTRGRYKEGQGRGPLEDQQEKIKRPGQTLRVPGG